MNILTGLAFRNAEMFRGLLEDDPADTTDSCSWTVLPKGAGESMSPPFHFFHASGQHVLCLENHQNSSKMLFL